MSVFTAERTADAEEVPRGLRTVQRVAPAGPPPVVTTQVHEAAGLAPRATPSWSRTLVRLLVLGDLAAAAVASSAALLLRFGPGAPRPYVAASVAFPFLWVAATAASRAYEPRFLGTGSEEYRRVFDAGVRLLAVVALGTFAFRLELARLFVLLAFPLAIVLSLGVHQAVRSGLHRVRRSGRCQHRVVVVGRERSVAELVRRLRTESQAGFAVVGACIDRPRGAEVEGVPVLGTSLGVLDALRRTRADTVAVGAWADISQADLRRLSWQLEGSGVSLVVSPSLTDVAGPRIHIRPVAGLPLLHVEEPEFSGGRRALKALLDRSLAALALLLLAPLLLALGLAVRATSAGPALFRQERTGVGGRPFRLWKLRSMHVGAEARVAELQHRNEAADGLLFKIRDDPRVTPLGRVLRRWSLDELPQLVNVLRGEMSLVGPRPPLPCEVEQYGSDVRRRLLVKPGLTGLWQVSGRSELSWDESVRLDLHYVENWSLALDLTILCRTVATVLRRQGAC